MITLMEYRLQKIRIPINNDADGRFFSLPFATDATTISSIEIADVKVAKKNKIKKHNKEKIDQMVFFANTAGRTINSNPGPSVGLTPNAKIAGKNC